MAMKKMCALLAVFGCLLGSAVGNQAHAATLYSHSKVFFDAFGNIVGQEILWCNNVRAKAGNTNAAYWRNDSYLCLPNPAENSGYTCTDLGQVHEIGNPLHNWACNHNANIEYPNGAVGSQLHLPPGISIDDTCYVTQDCWNHSVPMELPYLPW